MLRVGNCTFHHGSLSNIWTEMQPHARVNFWTNFNRRKQANSISLIYGNCWFWRERVNGKKRKSGIIKIDASGKIRQMAEISHWSFLELTAITFLDSSCVRRYVSVEKAEECWTWIFCCCCCSVQHRRPKQRSGKVEEDVGALFISELRQICWSRTRFY